MHPANSEIPCEQAAPPPARVILSRSMHSCAARSATMSRHYEIICGDGCGGEKPENGIKKVREYRMAQQESFSYNWGWPYRTTRSSPSNPTLRQYGGTEAPSAAAGARVGGGTTPRLFGIVAGNIKEVGIRAVEEHGPTNCRRHGRGIASAACSPRSSSRGRMKLDSSNYTPCFKLVS